MTETQAAREAFARTVAIATSNRSRLLVRVEFTSDGRLSLSGEHTSTNGGGGFGQMAEHLEADARAIAAEPGGRRLLGEADLSALVEIWRRWHLNDMRPGCEHQCGPDWNSAKPITFDLFSIEWDDRRAIERIAERDGAALGTKPGQLANKTPTQREEFRRYSHAAGLLWMLGKAGVRPFAWEPVTGRALAVLAEAFEIIEERERPEYLKACADAAAGMAWTWRGKRRPSWAAAPKPPILKRTRTERAGHVSFSDHPDGLLSKPCLTCGYKYGTAWKREEVPAEVLAELRRIVDGRPEPPDESAPYRALGLSLDVESIEKRTDRHDFTQPGARHWRCTLRRGRRVFRFEFSQGAAHTKPPTLADVLDCLRSDANLAADPDEAQACGVKLSEFGKLKRQMQQFRNLLGDAAEACGVS